MPATACREAVSIQGPEQREVHLRHPELSLPALKAVLAYLYTERLDVATAELAAVLRIAQ